MKALARFRKKPSSLVQVCGECEEGHIRPRYHKGRSPVWSCNHCHMTYVPKE